MKNRSIHVSSTHNYKKGHFMFPVHTIAFSYCGTCISIAFFFLVMSSQKGKRFHALTFVFALTQCAFVSYTYYDSTLWKIDSKCFSLHVSRRESAMRLTPPPHNHNPFPVELFLIITMTSQIESWLLQNRFHNTRTQQKEHRKWCWRLLLLRCTSFILGWSSGCGLLQGRPEEDRELKQQGRLVDCWRNHRGNCRKQAQ